MKYLYLFLTAVAVWVAYDFIVNGKVDASTVSMIAGWIVCIAQLKLAGHLK